MTLYCLKETGWDFGEKNACSLSCQESYADEYQYDFHVCMVNMMLEPAAGQVILT